MEHTKKLVKYKDKSKLISDTYKDIFGYDENIPDEYKMYEIVDNYRAMEYKYTHCGEYIYELKMTIGLLLVSVIALIALWLFNLFV